MKLSKKDYDKMKPRKDCGHWEGKYWCDCKTRGIRKWLGVKRYGHDEEEELMGEKKKWEICALCGEECNDVHIYATGKQWPLLERETEAHLDCYIHHAIGTAVSNHIWEEDE